MLLIYIIPAIVILLALFLALGYLKAPPDTAFIISGLGKKQVTVQCRKSYDPVTVGYDGVATGNLMADE